jgi:hypothetical protein
MAIVLTKHIQAQAPMEKRYTDLIIHDDYDLKSSISLVLVKCALVGVLCDHGPQELFHESAENGFWICLKIINGQPHEISSLNPYFAK